MNMKHAIITTIMMLYGFTLMAEVKPPVWLSGPYKVYPEDLYICGTGSGADLETAKLQAMSDLSRYFETQVTAWVQTSESEKTETDNSTTDIKLSSLYESQVKVFSDVKLESAILADSWTDPDTRLIYVLMTIEKARLADKYLERIGAKEADLNQLIGPQENIFRAYAALLNAETIVPEVEKDCNIYNALASDGSPRIKPSVSKAELAALISEARQNIRFDIKVKGDPGSSIATSLQSAVQKLGFSFGESPLIMKVDVYQGEIKQLGKQVFVTCEAELFLSLGQTPLFVVKEFSKQGDVDEAAARNRTMKALANGLSTKFCREFSSFLQDQ